MADNTTRIILTADDRTSPALASVTRGLSGMQAQALQAGAALSAIGVTAVAASIVGFVRSTANAADEMQKLSQRVGIATKDLAGWQLAADLSGASMESVAKGIKGLSTYAAEYGATLRQVGIDTSDPQKALVQLADLFAALPDGMEKTALATKLFGKAGLDLIPMLNQGSAALEAQRAKAEEYGRKMAEIGPDAERFNDQLEETAFYAKAIGLNIAAHFLPGLEGMSKWLVDIASGGDKAKQALEWMMGAPTGFLGRSQGYRGPLNAHGLPPSAEEQAASSAAAKRTAEQEAALKCANQLVNATGSGKGGAGATAKAKRAFDPEGDWWYKFEEEQRKATRAAMDAADKEVEALEKKRIAMEEMADARMEAHRIESEGEEAIREHMEKTNAALAKQKTMAQDLGLTFASAFEEAIIGGKGLQGILQGLAQDVARIFVRKQVTEPLANNLSGLFGKLDFGNLFGDFRTPGIADYAAPSFAGGGFTGSGPRSGGLDGQGGFLAMLHPNETVTDHARGGDASGAVTVQLNFAVGIAQTVRAEVMAMMPQIQAATTAGIIDARRRGGAVRAAFAG